MLLRHLSRYIASKILFAPNMKGYQQEQKAGKGNSAMTDYNGSHGKKKWRHRQKKPSYDPVSSVAEAGT
jgi:hypothetical protein